ncbi:MAG: hypothetical protein ACP5G0_13565 [Desulfomonilia bacterium]
MDKILIGGGVAGVLGGFCILVYQALMFLMHGTWPPYTLHSAIENGPRFILSTVGSSSVLMDFAKGCPLFVAVIVLGLILLFFGSKLKNRFS